MLENDLDYVVDLIRQDKTSEIDSYLKKKNIDSIVKTKMDTTSITLTKKVSVMTPGLNKILGKNYQIEANRVIANES